MADSTLSFKERFKKQFPQFLLILLLGSAPLIFVASIAKSFDEYRTDVTDFTAQLTGATMLFYGEPEHLYIPEAQKAYQELIAPIEYQNVLAFRMPPIVAALYTPFIFFVGILDYVAVHVVNILLLALIFYLIYKNFELDVKVFASVSVAMLAFAPLLETLRNGQVTLLITLIILLGYIQIKRGNLLLAGFLFGLTLIKPQFALVIPMVFVLLIGRKGLRDFLFGLVISVLAFVLVNSFLYTPRFIIDYPKFVLATDVGPFGTNQAVNYNLSLLFSMAGLGHSTTNTVSLVLNKLFYVGFLVVLYATSKKSKRKNFDLLFATSLLALPILSPHTMPSDLVVWMLVIYLLLKALYGKMESKILLGILLTIYLVPWLGMVQLNYVAVLAVVGVIIYLLVEISPKVWNQLIEWVFKWGEQFGFVE